MMGLLCENDTKLKSHFPKYLLPIPTAPSVQLQSRSFSTIILHNFRVLCQLIPLILTDGFAGAHLILPIFRRIIGCFKYAIPQRLWTRSGLRFSPWARFPARVNFISWAGGTFIWPLKMYNKLYINQ